MLRCQKHTAYHIAIPNFAGPYPYSKVNEGENVILFTRFVFTL